jgi:hypothetical protein
LDERNNPGVEAPLDVTAARVFYSELRVAFTHMTCVTN